MDTNKVLCNDCLTKLMDSLVLHFNVAKQNEMLRQRITSIIESKKFLDLSQTEYYDIKEKIGKAEAVLLFTLHSFELSNRDLESVIKSYLKEDN